MQIVVGITPAKSENCQQPDTKFHIVPHPLCGPSKRLHLIKMSLPFTHPTCGWIGIPASTWRCHLRPSMPPSLQTECPTPNEPVTKDMNLNTQQRDKGHKADWRSLAKWHQRKREIGPKMLKTKQGWRAGEESWQERWRLRGLPPPHLHIQTQIWFYVLTSTWIVQGVWFGTQISRMTCTHCRAPDSGVAGSWTGWALPLCARLVLTHKTGWKGQERRTNEAILDVTSLILHSFTVILSQNNLG